MTDDLKNIGVREGGLVYVHSSMKKVGWIEEGVAAFALAFAELLGHGGTLAVPTHTYSYVGRDTPPYDPATSQGETGSFPEAVRKLPGALRSGHASHSSAAVGRLSGYLTANHDLSEALGYESPLARVYRSGGKILLLGVGNNSNTIIHLAEFITDVPYVFVSYNGTWGDEVHSVINGKTVAVKQKKFPGCSGKFHLIDERLTDGDKVSRGMVGGAPSVLVDAAYIVDLAAGMIRVKPDVFLCDSCQCCVTRRKYMESLGG